MQKMLLSIGIFIFINTVGYASEESDFIKGHIATFAELNVSAQNFERELLSIKSKDTALKYIDQYSIAIEKALPVYLKFSQVKSDMIKEVSTDLNKLLTDIMHNNYVLLGKLVNKDFDNTLLQSECEQLVNKNQYISLFLRHISIGICMTTVKNKPKNAKSDEQFSKLTMSERDEVNHQLTTIFGNGISTKRKEDSVNSFEYSCVAIYEFLNMTWKFEKG